jgi:hypothetical protein
MKSFRFFIVSGATALALLGPVSLPHVNDAASAEDGHVLARTPLIIAEQGSFAVGGTTTTAFNGDQSRGDHAYVQYQIPVNARKYPLVMWHGAGQFAKTWESTPDGREGFQNIFLRQRFSVYTLDQPRRGRAGKTTVSGTVNIGTGSEAMLFTTFRLGIWAPPAPRRFFPGVQFPQDAESLDQYFRQVVPNIGAEDRNVVVDAVVALFHKIGPAILLTHSQGGRYGWLTRIKANNVKAIVSYEPASFVFPSDALPPETTKTADAIAADINQPIAVTSQEFAELTKVPIQIVYGDNIERTTPSQLHGVEIWRVVTERARQFVDLVNKRGGNASLLFLPDAGLKGNTHFPFSDLNNLEVAALLQQYLAKNGLD